MIRRLRNRHMDRNVRGFKHKGSLLFPDGWPLPHPVGQRGTAGNSAHSRYMGPHDLESVEGPPPATQRYRALAVQTAPALAG